MNDAGAPVACARFVALMAALGEDMPERVVTRTIRDHLATCPTCCRADAVLAGLLAGYRRSPTPALPADGAQRLVDRVCSQWHLCAQGEKT